MLIASTVASAAGGSGIVSSKIIRDPAKERSGTPDASVWFDSGSKLPVAYAAQVNAVISDAVASEDSDPLNVVYAETSGQDVLAAIVLGYEVGMEGTPEPTMAAPGLVQEWRVPDLILASQWL